MILEIDNVELYFKEKKVLGGIYLKAETGSITGILGRNGCGKSSLLRIIFGDLKPKYGLVKVDAKPILKQLYKTGLAGYLPQQNYLPNSVSIPQIFKLYKVKWEEFTMEFPEFGKYHNSGIKDLSGGERRLIETYLILKGDYKIMLLDEPFSHLSPLHFDQIIKIMHQQKDEKVIILTDHMYRHIETVADKFYLIKNNCTILMESFESLEDYGYVKL
ncbi:ABC-type cobalamin/Fe3+-siderophores transport system, ATPase component [Flavobacteriaceae bacterium MAR_2010_188]|nr:ABC-type cobalamin/Fe3+-siderophores transport system, ATPase component [Flavobacteriaceae bacterium MAR_2010_188]